MLKKFLFRTLIKLVGPMGTIRIIYGYYTQIIKCGNKFYREDKKKNVPLQRLII